ncbi:MAG TPA: hypothetical protein VH062_01510 [Polyangiaceae bacterium]|nr:hypothetical protein [Polyangiaceae bacterium]
MFLLVANDVLGAPADDRTRAAELFEQGVRQFSSAEYEAAARTFLAADDLIPSARALVNAITAGQRAGLHLVVARAAERALSRPDMDAAGTSFAREALATAAPKLSIVEATCAPEPCALTLDGATLTSAHEYALPGKHDVVATGNDGATASAELSCVAGATCRVSLTPARPQPTPPLAVPPTAASAQGALPAQTEPSPATDEHRRPLPPAVFIAGAVGTAALVALTVWSGVDTLSAKSSAGSDPDRWPHVQHLALRTDLLLTGALVLGAATGAAGLWFVDWGSGRRATAVILPGSGVAFAAEGHF